ncbi:DNA polymerase III subunit tau, partial [isoform gamma] [Buchnera aphidicola (Neophyllaphis podocarpi)]|uniref:DNA polymerase III subunit gamma/tau n=1 Tax=Buchnera aphidicola TaxID=9 RepID=UPI003464E6D3
MNYTALARKWRPKLFKEVVGQKYIINAISNGLFLQKIHHSWLFSGTRGVGKTTIARILAKSLNCEKGISPTPCRKCSNCKEIEEGNFIDFIEIDAASRTKVENIRELLDNMKYLPVKGKFKIYLIDEIHMLSKSSFNALLKTLEEPLSHIKIISATTEINRIPLTFISRCLYFNLRLISKTEILNYLKNILTIEKIDFKIEDLKKIAEEAQGSMRDALNITEKSISVKKNNESIENIYIKIENEIKQKDISKIIFYLIKCQSYKVIKFLNRSELYNLNWDNFLSEILYVLHNMALMKNFPIMEKIQIENKISNIQEITKEIKIKEIHLLYKTILKAKKDIKYAPSKKIGVEMIFLEFLSKIKQNTEIEKKNRN